MATHERPKPNARKRVLIPDVCAAMDVPTADTFDMMRATDARLHLETALFDDGDLIAPALPGLE